MSSLAESMRAGKAPWVWLVGGSIAVLMVAAVVLPNVNRSVDHGRQTAYLSPPRALQIEPTSSTAGLKSTQSVVVRLEQVADEAPTTSASAPAPSAAKGRNLVRTSSLEMVVGHPSEIADRIAAVAQGLGGYLVSESGGGATTTTATLTIRVPAARFDEARSEIRKLGTKIEGDKVEAQDVTQQYVDQDATIRNLKAEEAQYLTILKQAGTVKDMLAVTEKLSEVRGQIEQQQAEFKALSQQVQTVAISVSLRTEAEEQVLGLNWRPLRQIKLALRDGLESLADYATTMVTILFYVPATILWLGTIFLAGFGGWRAMRWIGRRWFGWKATVAPAQG